MAHRFTTKIGVQHNPWSSATVELGILIVGKLQMLFLAHHGFRGIAHDRRRHGRSSQPGNGNEMDTYADDLATLIETLDLS